MPQRDAALHVDTLAIEGGLFTAEWLTKVAAQQAPAQADVDYGVRAGFTLREEIALSWRSAQVLWSQFHAARVQPHHDVWAVTQRFTTELLRQCFAFQLQQATHPRVIDERHYPVAFNALGGKVPVVLSPHDETKPLDSAHERLGDNSGERVRRRSAFGLLQETLNAQSDALWGLATNGVLLRIARDNASLTRPAWVQVDLERLFIEERFADFSVLWLLLHASRFGSEGGAAPDCALEQWRSACREQGTRARETLRVGVEQALLVLGQGFVSHPANTALREALSSGALTAQDYFKELLRLVYRQIFLLTIEEREILHPPGADSQAVALYAHGYGLRRLRDRAVRRSAHDRYGDLWQGLKQVWLGLAVGQSVLALPPLGGLFETSQCPHLDAARLENRHLLLALFHLAWLRAEPNAPLSRVNWRDMGPEELGSIYESLLELVPLLSQEHRQFSFQTGAAVRGNARKTSGSYYTADPLVQEQLDSALEPVIEAVLAAHPTGEGAVRALLSVSVIDPACGSGHFLLAAARRIAGHLARVRVRDAMAGNGGQPTPDDYRHALRDVVTHCVYGVDMNPMALELARMALWLEAYTPDAPLGFIDHHLQLGNALLGVVDPKTLLEGVPDEAYKELTEDDKALCRDLKRRNRQERDGLKRMRAAAGFSQSLQAMELNITAAPLQQLDALPDITLADIAAKRQAYARLQQGAGDEGLVLALHLYCAAFLLPKHGTELSTEVPTTLDVMNALMGQPVAPQKQAAALRLAESVSLLHWRIAFAQVFARGGFTVVLGNPPWDIVQDKEADDRATDHERQKNWFNQGVYSILSGRRDLYKLFLCIASSILAPDGYLGLILPIGFLFEDDSSRLRARLFDEMCVERILHAQNRQKLFFPAVHASYRFLGITVSRSKHNAHTFTPVATSPAALSQVEPIVVQRSQLDDVLGATRSAVLFENHEHYLVHSAIKKSLASSELLSYRVVAEFHASTDKALLSGKEQDVNDWSLLKNGSFHFFNPHFGPIEKYVSRDSVSARLLRKELDPAVWMSMPRLVFRDIARNDDTRTLITALVPPGFVSTYDAPMLIPLDSSGDLLEALGFYTGFLSSFIVDFLLRPYVDKHIKAYTLAHIPIPKYDPGNRLMARISQVAIGLYRASESASGSKGPSVLEACMQPERCEIDAHVAALVGVDTERLAFVLSSFSSMRDDSVGKFGEFTLQRKISEFLCLVR